MQRSPAWRRYRVASLVFGLFGLLVYGAFFFASGHVPGWVRSTFFILLGAFALVSVPVMAEQLRSDQKFSTPSKVTLVLAGAIVLTALVALALAALS